MAIGNRAKTGTPYILRLPTEPGSPWTPGLVELLEERRRPNRLGNAGSQDRQTRSKESNFERLRCGLKLQARITPVDFNVVTEKWTGPPFDLVIATNVLVYYDRLDQALAFAGIEAMLRPGGFFLTNNVVVELPVSRLRSVGLMTVRHSAEKIDHVFWYRRAELTP